MNVNLEKYEVKSSFGGKFAQSHSLLMIRVVQHAHLSSVYFAISVSRKHRGVAANKQFFKQQKQGADMSASCVDGSPGSLVHFQREQTHAVPCEK